jgi:hypothetical protein
MTATRDTGVPVCSFKLRIPISIELCRDDGHPQKKKRGGVLVCLILLGVEQSWQGDFLPLARNFSWMHYTGAEYRRGVEESYLI